jgi:hypothetical protein
MLTVLFWAAGLFAAIFAFGAFVTEPWAAPFRSFLFAPARAVQRAAFEFPGTLKQGTWHMLAAVVQFAACLAVVATARAIIRKQANDI